MDLLLIACIFLAPVAIGVIAVKSRTRVLAAGERFARSLGMQSTEEFFSDIETAFPHSRGKIIATNLVKKVRPRGEGFGDLVTYSYQVHVTAEYFVDGKRFICDRSLFSMVPNRDESLANRALKLASSAKDVKVYYSHTSESDRYIIIDGIKSWKDLR